MNNPISYDLSGKVTSIIHPDNYTVTNTYYPGTGLLNTVTGTPSGGTAVEYAKCTKYEPSGKIGKITHAYNNTKTEYTYDLKSTRLKELQTTEQGAEPVIQYKRYTYSKAGDIETINDLIKNITYTYQYDNLHRLLSETSTDTSLPTDADIMVYNYDDSEHINAVTSIIYNGTDYGFTYDDNGNMRSGYDFTNPENIVQRGLTWNADNMPVTVTRGSSTTNLTYDGDGVRVKKIEVGATTSTTYYISNDYEIKDGAPIKYIFAGNLRVAEIEGTTPTIFHKDHLGSSTAMTNSTGTKVEGTEYLPFGGMREHTGTNTSDYLYTDQEHEGSIGLYNYDARLYDPVIGRFISADSEAPELYDPQILNRYTYVRNNPLIYTDPTGNYLYIYGIRNDVMLQSIWSLLQNIDPSVILTKIEDDKGTYYQVSFDSEISVEGHEKGHALLENLAGSEDNTHNIFIKTRGGNEFAAKSNGNSEIKWNYRNRRIHTDGDPDDNNSHIREPYIGLAHELGHSEAQQLGTQTKPPSRKERKFLERTMPRPWTPDWERNSLKRENDVRSETNHTLRTYYFQKPQRRRGGGLW